MNKIKNPFLDKAFPPNWSAMKGQFLTKDISKAIRISKRNIKKIKSLKNLSYENCIEAFENASSHGDVTHCCLKESCLLEPEVTILGQKGWCRGEYCYAYEQ